MTRYWFKRRRFGYGWTPATRQGWFTFAVYLVAVVGGALVTGALTDDSKGGTTGYLLIFVVLTLVFIAIAVAKGPRPKWRWGNQPDDNPDEDF